MTEILITILGLLGLLVGALVYLAKAQSRQNKKLTDELIKQRNKGHCCFFNGCWIKMKDYINKVCKEKRK